MTHATWDALEEALALIVSAPTVNDLPRIEVATTAQQLQAAWRLVRACYHAKGYCDGSDELRYDLSFLEPRTTCLLAPDDRAATVTAVFDSPLRLPSDALFGDLLDPLRCAGRRLCEFTGLAHAGGASAAETATVFELFRHAWLTAAHLEHATDIIITVNPAHVPFYRRCLRFVRVGPTRSFAKVQGAPGVLMRLDLTTAEREYRAHLGQSHSTTVFFFDDPHRPALLARLFCQRHRPDPWVIAWFFHQRHNLIDDLSPEQRRWVCAHHPGLEELLEQPQHIHDSGRLLQVG